MYNKVYAMYISCTNTYIQCMYFIHTMFRPCIYTNIQVFVCIFMYIHVQTMYIPCTYFAMSKIYKKKKYCNGPALNPHSCA